MESVIRIRHAKRLSWAELLRQRERINMIIDRRLAVGDTSVIEAGHPIYVTRGNLEAECEGREEDAEIFVETNFLDRDEAIDAVIRILNGGDDVPVTQTVTLWAEYVVNRVWPQSVIRYLSTQLSVSQAENLLESVRECRTEDVEWLTHYCREMGWEVEEPEPVDSDTESNIRIRRNGVAVLVTFHKDSRVSVAPVCGCFPWLRGMTFFRPRIGFYREIRDRIQSIFRDHPAKVCKRF